MDTHHHDETNARTSTRGVQAAWGALGAIPLPLVGPLAAFDPARALSALRAVLADPDDLPRVFTLIEALSGDTIERLGRRMHRTESGRSLLADQPDLVPLLVDRAALGRLPEGSLGRAYLDFMEREHISAEGIIDASDSGRAMHVRTGEGEWIERRLRDTHDVWHAVLGYHGDVLGELAHLGFILAQVRNPAIGLLVAAGLVLKVRTPEARHLVIAGIQRGLRAEWLVDQPWETMLAEPVDAIRARLRVGPPPEYTPVRSWELKATA